MSRNTSNLKLLQKYNLKSLAKRRCELTLTFGRKTLQKKKMCFVEFNPYDFNLEIIVGE